MKLLERVRNFRQSIESCWSQETAYQVPEIHDYGPSRSGGQCAVTCLVLKNIFEREFPDLKCQLVSGSLGTVGGEILIRDHVWLKTHLDDDQLIIDPTADQAPQILERVIIGTNKELELKNLRYHEREAENGYGEDEHPNRFNRYKILKRAYEQRHPG